MNNLKNIYSFALALVLSSFASISVAQIVDLDPGMDTHEYVDEDYVQQVQANEFFRGETVVTTKEPRPYVCRFSGNLGGVDQTAARMIRTEDGLKHPTRAQSCVLTADFIELIEKDDHKGNRKDSVMDSKDTLMRGIGKLVVDTTDEFVMVDDTLIYEDFDILEQTAPTVLETQNKRNDKDIQVIACGFTHFSPEVVGPQVRDEYIEETKELAEVEPNLFPNPARPSEQITIETGTVEAATIQIIDLSGKTIQVAENVINTHEFTTAVPGTYFVMILKKDGTSKHKKLLVH